MHRTAVVALALVTALAGLAAGQVRLLVIDRTETVEESLRLEVLARALAAGGVRVSATLTLPTRQWEGEGFDLVLLLPARGPYAWLCTPALAGDLSPAVATAARAVQGAAAEVFRGRRTVRTPGEDLLAWLLSAHLAGLGVLRGGA
ncbi:MAG: hypothetical protein ACP5G2_04060 [Candidatus Bipolaricaulaceae bacterium]